MGGATVMGSIHAMAAEYGLAPWEVERECTERWWRWWLMYRQEKGVWEREKVNRGRR